jgi:hypothetical protein
MTVVCPTLRLEKKTSRRRSHSGELLAWPETFVRQEFGRLFRPEKAPEISQKVNLPDDKGCLRCYKRGFPDTAGDGATWMRTAAGSRPQLSFIFDLRASHPPAVPFAVENPEHVSESTPGRIPGPARIPEQGVRIRESAFLFAQSEFSGISSA